MKVGIVGLGNVGAATAMAIAMRSRVRQLLLVNRNRARAKSVASDVGYGLALTGAMTITDGDYADLEGVSAVIVAAGINEKTGGATDRTDPAARLRLLASNVQATERSCRRSWKPRRKQCWLWRPRRPSLSQKRRGEWLLKPTS